MKLTPIRSLAITTMLSVACGVAHAQMAPYAPMDPNDDSMSYHHTEVLEGPDAAQDVTHYRAHNGPSHPIQTIDQTPQGRSRADVNFVTGGVGDDERAAIESSKSQYNLHVMNARADGAFVEDTHISVHERSGKGEEMLDVNAGPLLYAQLPAGSYVLDATHGSEQKHQVFSVGEGKKATANVHLSWHRTAAPVEPMEQ